MFHRCLKEVANCISAHELDGNAHFNMMYLEFFTSRNKISVQVFVGVRVGVLPWVCAVLLMGWQRRSSADTSAAGSAELVHVLLWSVSICFILSTSPLSCIPLQIRELS